jgi:hypothetical protein
MCAAESIIHKCSRWLLASNPRRKHQGFRDDRIKLIIHSCVELGHRRLAFSSAGAGMGGDDRRQLMGRAAAIGDGWWDGQRRSAPVVVGRWDGQSANGGMRTMGRAAACVWERGGCLHWGLGLMMGGGGWWRVAALCMRSWRGSSVLGKEGETQICN